MKQIKIVSFLLVTVLYLACTTQKEETTNFTIDTEVIDNYIQKTVTTHEVLGLAMAVVKNGEVIYEGYFGKASLAPDMPTNEQTIFRVYSTTKLITATAIFQLIEQGKLSLEDRILKHLTDLPAAWSGVKVKHLLTHSSGIADIIRYDNSLSDENLIAALAADGMDFETGQQFWYNQTNYWLLAKIIEQIEGVSFEVFVLKNQFQDEEAVLFSSNSLEAIPNGTLRYDYNNTMNKYEKTTYNDGKRAHPGNGLNISLRSFIAWNERLDKNELLQEQTKAQMWQHFPFGNQQDQFLHGWGIYDTNGVPSYGFTGGTVSAFRKFVDQDMTIILLTNGYRYFPIHNQMVDHVAGLVESELMDKESRAAEQLCNAFLSQPIAEAIALAATIHEKYPVYQFEQTINSLGYAIMRKGEVADAIKVFQLNVDWYPKSANVYDSLGEGYFNEEDYENALLNYEKSLALDAGNNNARVMIEEIKGKLGR